MDQEILEALEPYRRRFQTLPHVRGTGYGADTHHKDDAFPYIICVYIDSISNRERAKIRKLIPTYLDVDIQGRGKFKIGTSVQVMGDLYLDVSR